jgi:hypothetical protein
MAKPINLADVPESFRSKIQASPAVPIQVLTPKAKAAATKSELKEQRQFGDWLKKKKEAGQLTYIWPRSDKRTTIARGIADFTIKAGGRVLSLEFKGMANGKLSEFQLQNIRDEQAAGNQVRVLFSAAEAISVTRQFFNL